jgi:glycosyltransferase involved in cell wall biosynthesis
VKVLLFSRYAQLGASSRLRFYQYLPFLKDAGIDVTIAPLFCDDYIRGLYDNNISTVSVIKAYITRLVYMMRASQFDLVWVEKEMLPWIPSLIELGLFPSNIPLVVDYDDAVFHRYDQHQLSIVRIMLGRKIDKVMKRANLVVAGNEYLASRARAAGAIRVEIIPTVVDMARYANSTFVNNAIPVIGWIGSPSTAKFLHQVAPVLKELAALRSFQVVAIGANANQVNGLPIKALPWTKCTEVSEIQNFDIGIMPLPDAPFERGKCGYKLIQYMACGKPVIASPVGANCNIVQDRVDGFLASTDAEWITALLQLIDNAELRQKMGSAGRRKVEAEYSLQKAAGRLAELLKNTVLI